MDKNILDWQKSLFHNILWKNLNELFGQPNEKEYA